MGEIVQRSAAGASFNQVGHGHATLHSNAVKSAAESPPTVAFAVTLVDYQRDGVVVEIQSRAYEVRAPLSEVRVSMDHVKGVRLLTMKSSQCDEAHLAQKQCRQTHTLVFDVASSCQVKADLIISAWLLKHPVMHTLPVEWDACPRQ